MKEINGMVWGTGKERLRAEVKEELPRKDSEEQYLLLRIYDAENKKIFEKNLHISWDMWGSGFLKAMQVDSDPELEIVFYVYHSPEFNLQSFANDNVPIAFKFYLDINSGKIAIKDFNTASSKARNLSEFKLSTASPLTLILLFSLSIPFMIFYINRYISKNLGRSNG